MNNAHPHASPKMFCKVPVSHKCEQTPVIPICPMRNIEENVIKIVISASSVWPNNLALQIINGISFLKQTCLQIT